MKKNTMRKIYMLFAVVMLFGSSITVFASTENNNEMTSIANEMNYETTLVNGTDEYDANTVQFARSGVKSIFSNWAAGNDKLKGATLDMAIIVPTTGKIAYDDMNPAYESNFNALVKKYGDRKMTYAARLTYVIDGDDGEEEHNVYCFFGKEEGTTAIGYTNPTPFNPKSDEYVTAMYTLLYPDVHALIVNY